MDHTDKAGRNCLKNQICVEVAQICVGSLPESIIFLVEKGGINGHRVESTIWFHCNRRRAEINTWKTMKLSNNKAHFWINAFRNLSVSAASLCLGEGSTLVTRYLYNHMSHCGRTVSEGTARKGERGIKRRGKEDKGEPARACACAQGTWTALFTVDPNNTWLSHLCGHTHAHHSKVGFSNSNLPIRLLAELSNTGTVTQGTQF